jgi:hypothetical protein
MSRLTFIWNLEITNPWIGLIRLVNKQLNILGKILCHKAL